MHQALPDHLTNLQSLRLFLPEIAIVAGVLLVVLWDLFARGRTRVAGIVAITMMALSSSGAISVLYMNSEIPNTKLFFGLLAWDMYAHLFRIIFACVAAVIIVFALPESKTDTDTKHRKGMGEFFALLLVVVLGLNLMAMSRNLLMIYLSIELVSIISFVLAGFKPGDRRSSEGALKYVVFGGMASGIMVYGMSWLYGFAQSLDLADIAARVTNAGEPIPLAVLVGVLCMLAGFGYKISAAPFHSWTPDVYEGAPTSITAFLSVGPKAAGFAILIRFFDEGLAATSNTGGPDGVLTPWALFGGLLAMATMVVGNFCAFHQDNVKRMMAYSSIAHAGYMLLGFCVFNKSGVEAILFYIVVYAFMNLGAFLVVAAVAERHDNNESITTYQGLGTRAPVLAVVMTIFLFSLTGLPPFAGFIGKFNIFAALVQSGGSWNWTLAAVGVLNSAVSLFYYARLLRAMFLTKPDTNEPVAPRLSWATTAVALAVPTIVLGVYWGPLYELVKRSVGQ